jgi:hypothetical protein
MSCPPFDLLHTSVSGPEKASGPKLRYVGLLEIRSKARLVSQFPNLYIFFIDDTIYLVRSGGPSGFKLFWRSDVAQMLFTFAFYLSYYQATIGFKAVLQWRISWLPNPKLGQLSTY